MAYSKADIDSVKMFLDMQESEQHYDWSDIDPSDRVWQDESGMPHRILDIRSEPMPGRLVKMLETGERVIWSSADGRHALVLWLDTTAADTADSFLLVRASRDVELTPIGFYVPTKPANPFVIGTMRSECGYFLPPDQTLTRDDRTGKYLPPVLLRNVPGQFWVSSRRERMGESHFRALVIAPKVNRSLDNQLLFETGQIDVESAKQHLADLGDNPDRSDLLAAKRVLATATWLAKITDGK